MKNLLFTFCFLLSSFSIFAQLEFERNFFKDYYHFDSKKISKDKAFSLMENNELANQYLIEAKRNDLIRNISSVAILAGTSYQIIESLTIDDDQEYSSIYYASGIISTAGLIAALISNGKAKNRFKKAVGVYNSTGRKMGFETKLLITPDRVGILVSF